VTLSTTTITSGPPFGSIPEDRAAPELERNVITGSLSCIGNSPTPTNDGFRNSVKGSKSGQCSTM